MALIAVLTGHFKGFILFSVIIILHEFGHILMGIYFKWKIEKVIILPFGALTVFNEDLNRPIFEEFLVVIMGPIFQIIFTFIFYILGIYDFVRYSTVILMFNLLPIVPLDGSKILNLILNKFISFKRSHLILILISVLSVLICIFNLDFSLIFILIFLCLIKKICLEIRGHNNLFNRFLLERYLKSFHFKKRLVIHSMDVRVMRRDYLHTFFDGFRYISERLRLEKRFDFHKRM